ncbi:hypothetical protein RRG08_057884 [Elysia crispata]|uniref:Uncharacterized protein n=1 Tax=Elysia crispata TaxID=231223 RepID=A0AAE1B222_9GAST|nr:hypothetical protein RRG08_057884 [Elysia crispata]
MNDAEFEPALTYAPKERPNPTTTGASQSCSELEAQKMGRLDNLSKSEGGFIDYRFRFGAGSLFSHLRERSTTRAAKQTLVGLGRGRGRGITVLYGLRWNCYLLLVLLLLRRRSTDGLRRSAAVLKSTGFRVQSPCLLIPLPSPSTCSLPCRRAAVKWVRWYWRIEFCYICIYNRAGHIDKVFLRHHLMLLTLSSSDSSLVKIKDASSYWRPVCRQSATSSSIRNGVKFSNDCKVRAALPSYAGKPF